MNGSVPLYVLVLFWICQQAENAIYSDTWAVQIEGGEDVARTLAEKHNFVYLGQIMSDYYHFKHKRVAKRSVDPSPLHHASLSQEYQVKWLEQQVVKKRVKRGQGFNDPKWPSMWYLNRGRSLDMNVQGAWAQGITGKGVVVTILDDGIEKDHPDLRKNYDPSASYDVNNQDPDPQPRYDFTNENRHGTRCAGEVAAEANNNFCSVGVAYDAGIGGVRMLDGDVTDAVEAQSLSLNPQHIDIYSASWGPDDNGRTVDGPANLAEKAFYEGVSQGRGQLGSIFVWASGNGGRYGDSCNCDGYTNSIFTLSISSATENGNIPWYSEPCSSTLATTYSSGNSAEKQVVTTDLRQACTVFHTGTSASAPLAAGIVALALQANPQLTWRDLQHIVVRTARPANLQSSDWVTNGVGRRVSHSFGFGLMDAGAMVSLARNWTSIPPQHACEVHANFSPRTIQLNGKISLSLETDGCYGTHNYVRYLEHVQSKITLASSRRGEVQIWLISPQGTRSILLHRRNRDASHEGFNNWAFMTTHNWGELSMGRWTLEVENGASTSVLKAWTLVIRGTSEGVDIHNGIRHAPKTGTPVMCPDGQYNLDGYCYHQCPANFYPVIYNQSFPTANNSNVTQVLQLRLCQQCHMLCMHCHGPRSEDCDHCASGYELDQYSSCQQVQVRYISKDLIGFLVVALAVCIAAFVIFISLFAVLQARDHGWMCFRSKKRYTTADITERAHMNRVKVNLRLINPDRGYLGSDSDDDTYRTEIPHDIHVK